MASSSSSARRSDTDSQSCQRCHQPLLPDPSSSHSQTQHSLLLSSLPAPSPPSSLPTTSKLAALPPASRPAADIWAKAHGLPSPSNQKGKGRSVAESFILLSDSVFPSSTSHPDQAETGRDREGNAMTNIHAILSSRTPISHPLCSECTSLLQTELQKELEELSRERDAYIDFEREITRSRERRRKGGARPQQEEGDESEGTEEEWQALVKQRADLEKEEERLKGVLKEREKQLEGVRAEELKAKEEERLVELEEEEFLRSHHALSTHLSHLTSQLATARTKLLLSRSLLAHLESTNVYNDAFQIGHVPLHSGGGISVGTINGLRLGGRPVVDWEEINAAWGLVALCIDRVAVKVGCHFEGYKIVPLGSFSRIEDLPPGKGVYELYASSDLSPARILQNRRFNHALVALLDLLRQLVDFGETNNRGWDVGSISIQKDRISNHSVRLPGLTSTLPSMSIMGLGSSGAGGDKGDEGDEQWTKACRAVLFVLKRVLVVESEAERAVVGQGVPK